MARIDLPSGNWVEVRDLDTLKRKDRKGLFAGASGNDDPVTFGFAVSDRILGLLITAWSFEAPLPPTTEFLDELSLGDDRALEGLVDQARRRMIVDFTPKILDGKPDPKAPGSL